MAPTYKDFKRDLLPLVESIAESNRISIPFHKTDHYFTLPWTRGRLYVVSAENPLRGPNWGYGGINEVTLIPMMRYREFIGRVRLKRAKYPQIVSCGTPEGIASEYYEFFVEKPPGPARIIYGSTEDNLENINSNYIQVLKDSFDQVMLDAYLKGMFINMKGNRFYYSYDPTRNDDETIEEDTESQVFFSLDYNVEPMIGTAWHFDDGILKAFDQVVIETNARTDHFAQALKARGFTPGRTIIFPDPAGESRSTKGQPDNEILRQAGYEVRTRPQAPPIRQRQLNVNNLLEKRWIRLNPKKVTYLKKDLMGVELDTATMQKVKTNPKLTHASDGMDYLCDLLFRFSGRKPQTSDFKLR